MEKDFPEARAGALPPRPRVRVRRVELSGLLQVTLALLELSVPGVPPGRHSPPEAPGVQVLHRSIPDVPSPHAPAISSQTHSGVPPVHDDQCCHNLHLHHQDLPLAGQHGHTEVHVVNQRDGGRTGSGIRMTQTGCWYQRIPTVLLYRKLFLCKSHFCNQTVFRIMSDSNDRWG